MKSMNFKLVSIQIIFKDIRLNETSKVSEFNKEKEEALQHSNVLKSEK